MKVVGLSSTTNPYIRARWSAFTKENPQYEVFHVEFGKVSKTYAWKPVEVDVPYARIVLSDKPSQYQSLSQLLALVKSLLKTLSEIKPDILVLNGYQQPATLAALVWSKLFRKPTVLLSESKEDDAARRVLTEQIKKVIVSTYDSSLVGGRKHKEYLVKLGMSHDAIFIGHNVIGNDDYHPDKLLDLPYPLETDKPFFLSINRFISRKNIPTIVKAYAKYCSDFSSQPWDLILCGDGDLRPQIEGQIQSLGLQNSIHLPGFLQPQELLPYFAHAKCFIHASTQEQWGLVVNEAMAAGIPSIISSCCGCFEELIIDGKTGFGFDSGSFLELSELMLKVSSHEFDMESMKTSTLEHIKKFSPKLFATSLNQAVQYALT